MFLINLVVRNTLFPSVHITMIFHFQKLIQDSIFKKIKVLNHAGDTTYKTQSYPNSIMTKRQFM